MNKWKRTLSVAITTGLVTGCAYMPATFAMSDVQQEKVTPTNTFTTTLTGKPDNQNEYLNAGVYDKTKNEYTFKQDTSINTIDKGINVLDDLNINATGKNLNLNVIGNEKPSINNQGSEFFYDVNGIHNFDNILKIDVNTLNINVDGNKAGANGIYLIQTNNDARNPATIDINGNVNIKAHGHKYRKWYLYIW